MVPQMIPKYAKLEHLTVKVIREDTNKRREYKLKSLIKDDQDPAMKDIHPQPEPYHPPKDYAYDALVKTLQDLLGYDPSAHHLVNSRIKYDISTIFPPTEETYPLDEEDYWHQFLSLAVEDKQVKAEGNLYFCIRPREEPKIIQINDQIMQVLVRKADYCDLEEADWKDSQYDTNRTKMEVPLYPAKRKPSAADDAATQTSDTENEEAPGGAPPQPPAEAQEASPDPPKKAPAGPSKRRVIDAKVELIEDKGKFETQEAQDDDYGAVDPTTIDNYVGAYNTGDNTRAWNSCLEFFKINLDEYNRQEAAKNTADGRKRVPMKKFPGMSVGLFDYQLMAVFKLLRLTTLDVSGGFLADEQGLGKTQEMFGAIAFAHNLRKSRNEVNAAWKANGKLGLHNARKDCDTARTCPADERFGMKCCCYNELTRTLANALPGGLNLIVGPSRSCDQLLREAKSKLDSKVFTLRSAASNAAKEDKLTADEIKTLCATVTASGKGPDIEFKYKLIPGQSNYIIICPAESVHNLAMVDFATSVKLPDGTTKKKSGLVPGMIFMDEFHEYAAYSSSGAESKIISWLRHLKTVKEPSPLMYFVSGTPFEDSPADIRAGIMLFESAKWNMSGEDHNLFGASLAGFDALTATFADLITKQNSGQIITVDQIEDYRKRLHVFLRSTMVRRLGIDKFRGRNLTDIGPLTVAITDHPVPDFHVEALQSLADDAKNLSEMLLEDNSEVLGHFLRSKKGEALLLKLRLAATFPGIAQPDVVDDNDKPFEFTTDEITKHLAAAKGDLAKTPYYRHLPLWARLSPKLDTIKKTIHTMLEDKTPIRGEASNVKKLILFSPLEAESMLVAGWLALLKAKDKRIKPVWIHSGLSHAERQRAIAKFLEMGNAPPNILVAPMALAGTGLNLQKAKYSVVTSPAWSKRDNQQAYYRTHRVGQTQETKLVLLTARWNPAERVILKKYEGIVVGCGPEEVFGVGAEFAKKSAGSRNVLVDKHQKNEEKAETKSVQEV